MGLSLTLDKQYNHMYNKFENAYWAIKDLHYDSEAVYFNLYCYPTREAKLHYLENIESGIGIGGAMFSSYDPRLYVWSGATELANVFPKGIPLDSDEQMTAVYNWIKEYTKLPWKDVIEK